MIIFLILGLGGFDARDREGEMMGKHRPITAKEPIKCDAVFFANAQRCVYGQWASPRLILAISVWSQIDASCEFCPINAESLARVAEPSGDVLAFSNVRTPLFTAASS